MRSESFAPLFRALLDIDKSRCVRYQSAAIWRDDGGPRPSAARRTSQALPCWPAEAVYRRTPPRASLVLSWAASAALPITAYSGANCRHCSARRFRLRCAQSAKTENRSGWRATTSNALTPIEPVEPRMVKRCCIGGGLPSMNKPHGERQYWQQRVDAVQHAAVTGQ